MQNLYYQLYLSYLDARKNKRNTNNQLAFEIDVETKLYALANQIKNKTYTPKPSIAFMVYKPVQREIFAADFADRVVHHLIYRCIYQDHVDPYLIPDSYSCRKGKGTLHGAKRLNYFIRSCSNNYIDDAYILKLDIKGYFMNMRHSILYNKVIQFLKPNIRYLGLDYATIDFLLHQTIFANVAIGCKIKGNLSNWKTLPKDKSLFSKPNGIGLPIGNLTSQIFGNIYLNKLDHFVKNTLNMKYYGRYVDDMVFVHKDKNVLKNTIPLIQVQLDNLGLSIHQKKIYLQHYSKGALFLGHYIKPYRTYISNRTKNNFYRAIKQINILLMASFKIEWAVMKQIRAILNSYLGTLSHAKTYNLIAKVTKRLCSKFHYFFGFTKNYSKTYIKKYYWQWHYTLAYPFIN